MPATLKKFYDVLAPLRILIIIKISTLSLAICCNRKWRNYRGVLNKLSARLDTHTPWNAIQHPWLGNPVIDILQLASEFSVTISHIPSPKDTKHVINFGKGFYFLLTYFSIHFCLRLLTDNSAAFINTTNNKDVFVTHNHSVTQ